MVSYLSLDADINGKQQTIDTVVLQMAGTLVLIFVPP
jgi:hypothetical protein